jgi:hypothetical protein
VSSRLPHEGRCRSLAKRGLFRPAPKLLGFVTLCVSLFGLVTSTSVQAQIVAAAMVPSAAGLSASSLWNEPALHNPAVVTLTSADSFLKLADDTDYTVNLPAGVDSIPGGVIIEGGHNVVINGGDIYLPTAGRALYLKDQTGTIWIHDVHLSGPDLTEGIDLAEPGANVVMRDIVIDEVHGSFATNHADLVQTWAGPRRLLVDGLVGSTNYQGFFLLPNQHYFGHEPRIFDLRHVYINDAVGKYALWQNPRETFPLHTEDFFVNPPHSPHRWIGWWQWPQPEAGGRHWSGILSGAPPGSPWVHAIRWGATGISDHMTPVPLDSERRTTRHDQ